jgi:hypothetical protein
VEEGEERERKGRGKGEARQRKGRGKGEERESPQQDPTFTPHGLIGKCVRVCVWCVCVCGVCVCDIESGKAQVKGLIEASQGPDRGLTEVKVLIEIEALHQIEDSPKLRS